MTWTKEKVVFVLSLAALMVLLVVVFVRGPLPDGSYPGIVREPAPDKRLLSAEVDLRSFSLRAADEAGRDPFQPISEWRPAAADLLPFPPLGPLARRVPLPTLIAEAENARPPREPKKPEAVDEGQD